jgi:hypothetical protein
MKNMIDTILSAVAANANAVSKVIDLRFNYGYALIVSFSGTPNGTLNIEGSIDESLWTVIDTQAQTNTTSRSYNKDAIYYPFIRVSWVNTSSGALSTITAKISTKG